MGSQDPLGLSTNRTNFPIPELLPCSPGMGKHSQDSPKILSLLDISANCEASFHGPQNALAAWYFMLAKSPYPPLHVEGHQEMSAHPTWSRQERRRRVRTALHLPVFFFASGQRAAVETTTQNLCSGGFYCISPEPFPVNERAFCYMKIPIYQPDRTEQTLALKCRVRIVRVELLGEDGYGVGCEIEDYCFLKAVGNGQGD